MAICPLCRSKELQLYIEVNSRKIVKCRQCSVVFTSEINRKNSEVINNSVYSSGYIINYKRRKAELLSRFNRIREKIELYKYGGKILDIGSSLGFFLESVKNSRQYEWEPYGLEANKRLASESGKNFIGAIAHGFLPVLPYQDNFFDCVTCFDVLEHSLDFQENLKQISRVLKKDGVFVIQCPNYISLMAYICKEDWDWWSPPDHVFHFSYEFLKKQLIDHGFKIVYSKTYEETRDFILNVKGRLKKRYHIRYLFYLLLPFLYVLEKISSSLDFGALSFIIVKKI